MKEESRVAQGVSGSLLGWKHWVEDKEFKLRLVELEVFVRRLGTYVQAEPEMKV